MVKKKDRQTGNKPRRSDPMKTNKTNTPKTIRHEIVIDISRFPDTFAEMEKDVLKKIEEAKQSILKQIFSGYENYTLPKPRYALKDRRAKRFHTIIGEQSYERYRAYDRKSGEIVCPLDQWLGVEGNEKVCGLLKDEIIRLSVDCPFRFVARELKRWTANDLGKDTIWAVTQRVGQKCWKEKNDKRRWKRHEPLPKPEEIHSQQTDVEPSEILCIGIDGTYVKRQEKRVRTRKKHDVKVAVLYTGKKKIHGDMKLQNRTTVIQARSEKLNDFLGRVTAQAIEQYGLNQNTTVLLFGDGDAWIKRFKDYVPQAHYRLDPWHVYEKITLAFGLSEVPSEWKRLVYGNPEGLIAAIKTLQSSLISDPTTNHTLISELITYLENNKEGLRPWSVSKDLQQKHSALFTWGSGHVESQIQLAVYDRHKLNRMSWSKRGLQNLSTLRENRLNNHKKPIFTCSKQPLPSRVDLGSLGLHVLTPSF